MARVAFEVVGSQDLPEAAFREAVAAVAVHLRVIAVGPVVREEGCAALAATARASEGPVAFAQTLEWVGLEVGLRVRPLAYGALVYRSSGLNVPPSEIGEASLRSLAAADPDFEIPGLGRVGAHLRGTRDRQG